MKKLYRRYCCHVYVNFVDHTIDCSKRSQTKVSQFNVRPNHNIVLPSKTLYLPCYTRQLNNRCWNQCEKFCSLKGYGLFSRIVAKIKIYSLNSNCSFLTPHSSSLYWCLLSLMSTICRCNSLLFVTCIQSWIFLSLFLFVVHFDSNKQHISQIMSPFVILRNINIFLNKE